MCKWKAIIIHKTNLVSLSHRYRPEQGVSLPLLEVWLRVHGHQQSGGTPAAASETRLHPGCWLREVPTEQRFVLFYVFNFSSFSPSYTPPILFESTRFDISTSLNIPFFLHRLRLRASMHSQQEADALPLPSMWLCSPRPISDDVTQVQTSRSQPWPIHELYQLTHDLQRLDSYLIKTQLPVKNL